MKKTEALDLLHAAMWSLSDNGHSMCYEVEDIYIRFESFTRDHWLEMASIIRGQLRAAAIFTTCTRRAKCFLFWILTTTEGP